jgi:hypothetical protein
VKNGTTKTDSLLELNAEASRQFGDSKSAEDFESILEKPRLNSSPETVQVKLNLIFRGFQFYLKFKPKNFHNIAKHLNTPLIFESKNFEPLMELLKEDAAARTEILSVLKALDSKQFTAEQIRKHAQFKAQF